MVDILFIVPSFIPAVCHESIGTLLLANVARKAGYNVEILRYWEVYLSEKKYQKFSELFVNLILSKFPQIVSFYCRSDEYHICIDLAKKVKFLNPKIKIIFGGPQADLSSKETIKNFKFVDYICCGEGERTIVPLLDFLLKPNNKINMHNLEGLVFRDETGKIIKNRLPELLSNDYSIDFKYYDLLPEQLLLQANSIAIDGGRGCPYDCFFCSTKTFWKQKFRFRNIENILEEIEYVIVKYGICHFSFVHDLFTANRNRIITFCSELKRRKVRITWDCSSRLDTIDNDLIDLMTEVGLKKIYYGVETGSQKMQYTINKRLNLSNSVKLISYSVVKNINVTTSFIYGFPEETEDELNDTISLMLQLHKIGVQNIQLHLLSFDLGTTLVKKYKNELVSLRNSKFVSTYAFIELYELIAKYPDVFVRFYEYPSPIRLEMKYLSLFFTMCINHFNRFDFLINVYVKNGVNHIVFYRHFLISCSSILHKLENYKYNSITNALLFVMFDKFSSDFIHEKGKYYKTLNKVEQDHIKDFFSKN